MKTYSSRGTWSKMRPLNLKIGFIVSLSFVFFAFQLSVEDREAIIMEVIHEDIIKDPAVAFHKEKIYVPPASKVAKLDKKPIDELFEIEEVKEKPIEVDPFDNMEIEDIIDDAPITETAPGNAPMIAPIIEAKEVEIEVPVDIAQQMPTFTECVNLTVEAERRACTERSLLTFIRSKIRYPAYAREVGLEGTVFAQFVIGKDGKIRDLKLFREIGAGTSEEITRVIGLMPDWIPGKQNFRPVSVRMTIPVKFQLL